ncbi:MAG: hypothetical protein IKT31_04910, partial [Firmicutes bacterium]|nr:hypothetical protein [Bacillota bacterium]
MLKRVIALTIILCMTITSLPAMGYATVNDSSSGMDAGASDVVQTISDETTEQSKDLSEVTEEDIILEESSESMTTFDLGGGKNAKIFYTHNVRYTDENGNLVDIDPELVAVSEKSTQQGESLTGYKYKNNKGKTKTYIPEEFSESTPLMMENGEYSITMTPTGWLNSILSKSKTKGK